MKVKTIYREEILRAVLATLATLFVLLSLVSCQEYDDPFPPDPEFTFFVYDLDNEEFTARVDWGVNGLQEFERFTSWGFASSVELGQADELVLQVDREGLVARVTNNKTKGSRLILLAPGEFTIIKPFK